MALGSGALTLCLAQSAAQAYCLEVPVILGGRTQIRRRPGREGRAEGSGGRLGGFGALTCGHQSNSHLEEERSWAIWGSWSVGHHGIYCYFSGQRKDSVNTEGPRDPQGPSRVSAGLRWMDRWIAER